MNMERREKDRASDTDSKVRREQKSGKEKKIEARVRRQKNKRQW